MFVIILPHMFMFIRFTMYLSFDSLGKLGHGDTNRVYKPKVIEALNGIYIRKLACASQASFALTSTGQVCYGQALFILFHVTYHCLL